MADLEDITETPRTDVDSDLSDRERDLARQSSARRKRSQKGRNPSRSRSPAQISFNHVLEEKWKENESAKWNIPQPKHYQKMEDFPTQEDHQARFYEHYREVAERHDKEFLKKHDEDLNTTLIFAGLFSAVTSAFIIQVDSQLQPDPGNETAALLRLILYKMDNTTFGSDVPTLPHWKGPPHTIVQVQTILFTSLAISLLSAFLAMLGKQWLNRYESTAAGGSAIERSHNRQRKLGGMVGWYFDHLMGSLPLMLQAALLFLGCALTRYLWDIDLTVASVIASVTASGLIFYLFIVIAGTVSESCPYQTPAAHVFRYILHYVRHRLLRTLRSAFATTSVVVASNLSRLYHASRCGHSMVSWWSTMRRPWYSRSNLSNTLLLPPLLFFVLAIDAYALVRAIVKSLIVLSKVLYHQVAGSQRTYRWFTKIRTLGLGHQSIMMDLRCISWILQTSLDKGVHLSAFKYLISMPDLTQLHPSLVVYCFNIFVGCVSVTNGKVVITQGLEELAPLSADGFLRTLYHLATMNPTSRGLARLQRRYKEVFPSDIDFTGLPFQFAMMRIHTLAGRFGNPRDIRWNNHGMSVQEHIAFAQRMVGTAQEKYQQSQHTKVPRWILRSALYFLSLGPLSPESVVADCLTVIAMDLGCDIPSIVILDDGTRTEHLSDLIIQKLGTLVKTVDSDLIIHKRKAINTLFPYAIYLEQNERQEMIDAILRTARASNLKSSNCGKFMWHHVVRYTSRLFETQSPTSLNRVIALISPYVPWGGALNKKSAVARWAAAASAIPYTDQLGQNVIDALFQIAFIDLLRPHIPIHMWEWMKRRPSLPPMYHGLLQGPRSTTVAYVRRLGDIDLLKSYFLLVWTDQCLLLSGRIHEVESSIREDFGAVGMGSHRKDLLKRLDHVINQLDHRSYPDWAEDARVQYTRLRELLLEVDAQ